MSNQQDILNNNCESEEVFSKSDDFNHFGDQDFSNLNREDYPPQFYAQRISQEGDQAINDFIRGDIGYDQNQFLTQYNYSDQYNNNYAASEVNPDNQKNILSGQNNTIQQNQQYVQAQQFVPQNNKNSSYTASTCDYMSSDYCNQSQSESSHSNYQANSFRPTNSLPQNQKNQYYQFNSNSHQSQHQNATNINQVNYGSSPEHFSENSTQGHTPYYVTEYNSNQNSNGIDDEDAEQEEGIDKNSLNQTGLKIKKNIAKKKYEPLYDNNQVYRYEDDPLEYKKARKRIQNRQSARKVRSIKKNQTENLEMNVDQLKQENQDLKVQVANLSAQNKRLLDEVEYFRRMYGNIIQNYHQENNNSNEINGNEDKNGQEYTTKIIRNNRNHEGMLPTTRERINVKTPYGQNQQLFILVVISCILVMSYSSTSYENQIQSKVNAFLSISEIKNITKTVQLESEIKQIVQDTVFYDSWKIIGWTLAIIAYLTYATLTIYKNFKSKFYFNKNKQKDN
ncbi:bZIP transcription factor (macronuclear) [Tetrahymena thermophila SB210]|uniref:BZIP transcription factor n=1 Tax=Tetrahymena thermophila (strain SB210) TaxID=312017 RepID=Q245S7_TETTS|nr:bZIP transcription factor [Tetrahymena thermophila SB210]EAS03556.2 bZIP transcription factor [Tetrahymena thermophila SB210]|eukprot:XP_001023801.2 bZIP transcription factor [Tetrahymena thermophila SB210]